MVEVPTLEQFNELDARVTKLEQPTPIPPEPIPPNPEPGEGVQARRIVSAIDIFGVNTFSSLDEHNLWGSWPADYRPASVIAALNYMTAGTGFAFRLREYHYKGREGMQKPWLTQIRAAIPDTATTICPAANANVDAVPTMIALAKDPACGIDWVEGLNEPNTDFGSGEVGVQQTKAIQDAVWGGGSGKVVLGPSVVAGTPHPEGWITGYCGDQLPAINAAMQRGNGHYYPPGCPDVPSTGYSTAEYVGGLWTAYAQHPIDLTEFHPTLYNSQGNKPDEPGWDSHRDGYYTLLTWLRCAKAGVLGLWWYALFDYGTVYKCGLFAKAGTDEPRPAATIIRNFCRIVADTGAESRTFTPGRLPVTVQGLPEDDWSLYQTSAGVFLLVLWRAAKDAGGATVPVHVMLDRPANVTIFDPLASELPIKETQSDSIVAATLDMPAGVRILAVR